MEDMRAEASTAKGRQREGHNERVRDEGRIIGRKNKQKSERKSVCEKEKRARGVR